MSFSRSLFLYLKQPNPNHMRVIFTLLLIGIIAIQFFPAEKNQNPVDPQMQVQHLYSTPDTVQAILTAACLDCHSNTTQYPWYTHIQPVGWWMADHVKEGKRHLNFDEFGTYSKKKQAHKMEEVVEMIEKGAMPLKPYPTLHKGARLSDVQKQELIAWARDVQAEIEAGGMD